MYVSLWVKSTVVLRAQHTAHRTHAHRQITWASVKNGVTLCPVGTASWLCLPPQRVAWRGFSPTCELWYNSYHHPYKCGLFFNCVVPVWQGRRLLGWGSWTLQLQLLQTQPGQQGLYVQSSSEILWASPLLLSVLHLYPALSLPDPNPKALFRFVSTACSTSQIRHTMQICAVLPASYSH